MTTLDMSAYGYYRDTTPFIKKWSKDASLFTRAYSASTTTSTTTVSLMTGKRLWTHLRFTKIHAGKIRRSSIENIAYELKKAGYYIIAIATNSNASVISMGISESIDYITPWTELITPTDVSAYIRILLYNLFGEKIRLYEWLVMEDFALHRILSAIPLSRTEMYYPTEITIARFLKIINNEPHEPFFAWIHFHPPHTPYTPPPPFRGTYNSSSEMSKKREQEHMDIGNTLNKMEDSHIQGRSATKAEATSSGVL